MKRKILIALYIVLLIVALKQLYNIGMNSILIKKYREEEYNDNKAKILANITLLQNYVAHYNYGNILYKNGEYKNAIEQYKKALEGVAPRHKECSIRINYALAICQTVQLDEKDQNSIKNAINIYESAIDILTKEGCANKDNDNGHSQKAEQLKKDIQKEIDRLKKIQEKEAFSSKGDSDSQENNQTTNEEAETIEKKIQNIKENATKDQRETESQFNKYNKDIKTRSKNW